MADAYDAMIQILAFIAGIADFSAGLVLGFIQMIGDSLDKLITGCSTSTVLQFALVTLLLAAGFALMAPFQAPFLLGLMVGAFSAGISKLVSTSFDRKCKA